MSTQNCNKEKKQFNNGDEIEPNVLTVLITSNTTVQKLYLPKIEMS